MRRVIGMVVGALAWAVLALVGSGLTAAEVSSEPRAYEVAVRLFQDGAYDLAEKELAEFAFEEKKEEGEKKIELPNARQGAVVTRFPPEPSGFPHIGIGYPPPSTSRNYKFAFDVLVKCRDHKAHTALPANSEAYSQYLAENLWQYVSDDEAKVLIDSDRHGIPITFCCLDAPARSWLRLGLLHLDGGRVGDRQVVPAQWMKDVVTPSPTNPNYGYFTWLGTKWEKVRPYNSKSAATAFHSEPFAAPDVIYFDGFGGQRVYIVPSKQLVIVHTGPLRQDWDDAILPNLIIHGARGGTYPTVAHEILSLARLPVPPLSHG